MTQIKTRQPYKVVELFSGAGGLASGMEDAGLECELLVEADKNAVATLKANKPRWPVVYDDIANVDFTGVKADAVAGGFPCQSFSLAGKKLGFKDTRGILFFQYARAIREIQPNIIIGENVKGLKTHEGGRTLSAMLRILDGLGYRVSCRIVRAHYLGVPQKRERLVLIGVKKGAKSRIAFPKEQNGTVTLREALQNVPISRGQRYTARKQAIMELIPEGGCWRDLPEDLRKNYMGASYFSSGGKTGMARRLSWNKPSLTLTCSPAQKETERCHPSETRPLTVREYARIQTFPDGWEFCGPLSAQYRQIGNAVPVKLGHHIGRCIVAMLDNAYDPDTMDIV